MKRLFIGFLAAGVLFNIWIWGMLWSDIRPLKLNDPILYTLKVSAVNIYPQPGLQFNQFSNLEVQYE